MRLQNVFTVVALLALAALVFIVVRSVFGARPRTEAAKVERVATPNGHLPQIYIAKNTMEVGAFVNASDLEAHDWPEQAILPTELRADQVPTSDLTGAVVRERIERGEPILREKLVRPGDRGFLAAVLLPGMRAMTVAVDNISGHSGLLIPGDRVDVILTQNIGGANGGHSHVSETIARAVRVLAMGTQMNPPKSDNVDDHPHARNARSDAEAGRGACRLDAARGALAGAPQPAGDRVRCDGRRSRNHRRRSHEAHGADLGRRRLEGLQRRLERPNYARFDGDPITMTIEPYFAKESLMRSVVGLVAANPRKIQVLVCLLAFFVGFITAFDAKADEGATETVAITVHGGKLLRLTTPANNVFVADPTIADVQVPAANSVYVLGKKAGRTHGLRARLRRRANSRGEHHRHPRCRRYSESPQGGASGRADHGALGSRRNCRLGRR